MDNREYEKTGGISHRMAIGVVIAVFVVALAGVLIVWGDEASTAIGRLSLGDGEMTCVKESQTYKSTSDKACCAGLTARQVGNDKMQCVDADAVGPGFDDEEESSEWHNDNSSNASASDFSDDDEDYSCQTFSSDATEIDFGKVAVGVSRDMVVMRIVNCTDTLIGKSSFNVSFNKDDGSSACGIKTISGFLADHDDYFYPGESLDFVMRCRSDMAGVSDGTMYISVGDDYMDLDVECEITED